jgi:hypothetical protein
MGLELQLEELIEQRERALVQGRDGDAARLSSEIASLQNELAVTAEVAATAPHLPESGPVLHNEAELAEG